MVLTSIDTCEVIQLKLTRMQVRNSLVFYHRHAHRLAFGNSCCFRFCWVFLQQTKQATVAPLLIKRLCNSNSANYPPVSNLNSLSELHEHLFFLSTLRVMSALLLLYPISPSLIIGRVVQLVIFLLAIPSTRNK